jgi:subtilisin-like proprotein convertase family protein
MTIAVSTTHRLALTAALLLLGSTSMALAQSVFTSTHAPLPIPPGGGSSGTTVSTIQVGRGLMVLQDVNVGLTLNHSFQGDLRVAVAAPSGTSVELFGEESSGTDCGGLGGGVSLNGTYVFDQSASVGYTDAILAAIGPGILGSGTYAQGNNAVGLLSDFYETPAAGDWTLTITDTCLGDTGTLTQWQLIM